jgi:antitoxin component of RelBE/YafQ-DinJ toxin-antitoxin module
LIEITINLLECFLVSQTIYARVPDQVKKAADGYASTNGLTLANAVAFLLDRGLQAVGDESSVAALERRVSEQDAELAVLRERDRTTSTAYRALAQRTTQPVGTCPQCGGSISGHDLLVAGRCANPDCGANLTPLLGAGAASGSIKGGLDDGDLKVLLGALGLLLGIALVSQQGGGG